MKSGEPSITRRAVHDSGGGNLPLHRVVIHATCPGVGYPKASKKGAASGTGKYFQNPASGGSAHYVYDSSRHEEHCVPEKIIAWHAPPNPHSVGIEICGEANYTRTQWLSDAVWPGVEEAAKRTRELCDRHGIPLRRLTVAQVKAGVEGICGHVDVSRAFRQTDHTDPGPNFPWDRFMDAVKGDAKPPAEPVHDDNPVPEFERTLRLTAPMMRGTDIEKWQTRARRFSPKLAVDGWYGADSMRACEAVQREVGLPVTGVVDPETWLLTYVWAPESKKEISP